MTQAKLKTNLDTNFLKLIAICSMLLDHVGSVFFPQIPLFRWVGRLAFPPVLLLHDGGPAVHP